MPRGIFRDITLTTPPKVEDPVLGRWLDQTVRELQRFSKDISNFLVQDVAVARVSKQELPANFQIMSDGLFVEVFSYSPVTSNVTQAFRPGVIGSWLIVHNIGGQPITIKDGAETFLGGDIVLNTNHTLTVRYDGAKWVRVATF